MTRCGRCLVVLLRRCVCWGGQAGGGCSCWGDGRGGVDVCSVRGLSHSPLSQAIHFPQLTVPCLTFPLHQFLVLFISFHFHHPLAFVSPVNCCGGGSWCLGSTPWAPFIVTCVPPPWPPCDLPATLFWWLLLATPLRETQKCLEALGQWLTGAGRGAPVCSLPVRVIRAQLSLSTWTLTRD